MAPFSSRLVVAPTASAVAAQAATESLGAASITAMLGGPRRRGNREGADSGSVLGTRHALELRGVDRPTARGGRRRGGCGRPRRPRGHAARPRPGLPLIAPRVALRAPAGTDSRRAG